MPETDLKSTDSLNFEDIHLQPTSEDIWDQKYRLKDAQGTPVDKSVVDTWRRIAKALAEVELNNKDQWFERFLWALTNGAIPGGRIISNAGAQDYKPATSTINCTVSGTIHDSMRSILEKNLEAGLTLKAGCGIGYEFSGLRPKGAHVAGAGAQTSGPLSFMEMFDKMCFTISSAGGRRGAQMATFDISHPDIGEFINAKRTDGCLRQFNLSLLICDQFVDAVKNNKEWPLSFPILKRDFDHQAIVWRKLPHLGDDYHRNDEGEIACEIYKFIPARDLWEQVMKSTYDYAEPGFILIDRVNELNNNWFCETIRATNPCGEQPLPPYGSCLLGSINLTKFVDQPFSENARFNWDKFRKVTRIFTRMLDNVVEVNGLALQEQRNELENKRRHGMGFLGLGSTLTMLTVRYGSPGSIAFTEQVSKELALSGWREGLELAKEKGPAPIMEQSFEITSELLNRQPKLSEKYKIGDKAKGKVLFAEFSHYMNKVCEEDPRLVEDLAVHGCRFTHHSSIAPTGTISLSIAQWHRAKFCPPLCKKHHSSRKKNQRESRCILL